jgi:hypothetical protein
MLRSAGTPLKVRLLFAMVPFLVICGLLATTEVGGAEAHAARAHRTSFSGTPTSTARVFGDPSTTSTTVASTPVAGSTPAATQSSVPGSSTTSTSGTSAGGPIRVGSSARSVNGGSKPARTTTTVPSSPAPPSGGSSPPPSGSLSEDFSSLPQGTGWTDGSAHGQWLSAFSGYGQSGIESDGTHGNVLTLSPAASTSPSETHAALVHSAATFADTDITLDMRTLQQLRSGSAPNPWETGWVLWHYADNTHFYYFIPKPNGWELGKEDPAYPGAQRFLAAGSSPSFVTGPWNTVHVRQVGNSITVWVNGAQVVSFTDNERPYSSGSLGLYTEDAHVHFDNIDVTQP